MNRLRYVLLVSMILAVLLGACAPTEPAEPQIVTVKETVVVEKEVPIEKVVKETVVVEKEVAVEKVVKETVVVEKEVEVEKVVKETVIVQETVKETVLVTPTPEPAPIKEGGPIFIGTGGMTITDRGMGRVLLTEPIEGAYNFEQMVRLISSEAAGKIIQALDGTYRVRDVSDTKDRFTGDDTANGGRDVTIADVT